MACCVLRRQQSCSRLDHPRVSLSLGIDARAATLSYQHTALAPPSRSPPILNIACESFGASADPWHCATRPPAADDHRHPARGFSREVGEAYEGHGPAKGRLPRPPGGLHQRQERCRRAKTGAGAGQAAGGRLAVAAPRRRRRRWQPEQPGAFCHGAQQPHCFATRQQAAGAAIGFECPGQHDGQENAANPLLRS